MKTLKTTDSTVCFDTSMKDGSAFMSPEISTVGYQSCVTFIRDKPSYQPVLPVAISVLMEELIGGNLMQPAITYVKTLGAEI